MSESPWPTSPPSLPAASLAYQSSSDFGEASRAVRLSIWAALIWAGIRIVIVACTLLSSYDNATFRNPFRGDKWNFGLCVIELLAAAASVTLIVAAFGCLQRPNATRGLLMAAIAAVGIIDVLSSVTFMAQYFDRVNGIRASLPPGFWIGYVLRSVAFIGRGALLPGLLFFLLVRRR